ncbi:protein S100-A13-like isoform X2 [Aquarana catesbeiana]|uniref:protein S100-A13-like isoform X2 n=1 Tax=Aquarana catesbeiana TaxID=8400 RepID=UPI003CCA25AB
MFCLLIFLSLFSAYSTKYQFPERDPQISVETFNTFANKEGNMKTINANELMEFAMLNPLKDLDFAQGILQSLDENRDGELQYSEFVNLPKKHLLAIYNRNFNPQK